MENPYIDRNQSWLMFNGRVLEEAADQTNPLLERLKFLSIFCTNLDEFFMVQIGGLLDRMLAPENEADPSPQQQLELALSCSHTLMQSYDAVRQPLFAGLEKADIHQLCVRDLPDNLLQKVKERFFETVMPLVTAVIVDTKHPFPFLPCGAAFAAAGLRCKNGEKLGLVLFPEAARHPVYLEGSSLCCFLPEDAAACFAGDIFPKHEVIEAGVFRVTRNADLVMDDDALPNGADYRQALAHVLEKRKKLQPVRLQSSQPAASRLTRSLAKRLGLKSRQVFRQHGPLDMRYVYGLISTARAHGYADLLYSSLKSVYVPGLRRGESVIDQVRQRDRLMIHPYVDFDAVLALLREAAYDESVVAIRQTLYRVSAGSEVVRYLCAAAQNGKEVTIAIELNARFDEASNLGWAAALENAGCRVIYGRDNLKVHAKLLLITRNIPAGIRHTAHVATGNYNENTTRLYSDIGLLTSDTHIAQDIMLFFRELGADAPAGTYRSLHISPGGIRAKLCRLLDAEIAHARSGGQAHVIFKANALTDRPMIDKLIEASKAGVKVELIIRGTCCLKSGIEELTHNIRIVSIVGRFLEHARVYWFGSSEQLFISSADLMPRNLDRRMEVLCPVADKRAAVSIMQMLHMQLCDNLKGRQMNAGGHYERISMPSGVTDSQMALYSALSETAALRPHRLRRVAKSARTMLGTALIRLGKRFTHS